MYDWLIYTNGVGNGNRTHLTSLGSSYSTDKLYLQDIFILPQKRKKVNKYLSLIKNVV